MYTYEDIMILNQILLSAPNSSQLRDIINFCTESKVSADEIIYHLIQPYPISSELDEFIFWTKIEDVPLWLSKIDPEETGVNLLNNLYKILIQWRFKIGK